MKVTEVEGDVFSTIYDPGFDGFAHGVNCLGVMGAGVAVGVRSLFPEMYKAYRALCQTNGLHGGDLYPWHANGSPYYVYNLATQVSPGPDARLGWVRSSVTAMADHARYFNVNRIATVRMGCGIGGLEWPDVKDVLETVPGDIELVVFRPKGTE